VIPIIPTSIQCWHEPYSRGRNAIYISRNCITRTIPGRPSSHWAQTGRTGSVSEWHGTHLVSPSWVYSICLQFACHRRSTFRANLPTARFPGRVGRCRSTLRTYTLAAGACGERSTLTPSTDTLSRAGSVTHWHIPSYSDVFHASERHLFIPVERMTPRDHASGRNRQSPHKSG